MTPKSAPLTASLMAFYFVSVQSPPEADAQMGLNVQEIYWGKCSWTIKKEGTEVGGYSHQITVQVSHVREERDRVAH